MHFKFVCAYKIVLLVVISCNLFYLLTMLPYGINRGSMDFKSDSFRFFKDNNNYIIDTPGCKIENLDVYHPELKPFLYKVPNISCSNREPISYIERKTNKVILKIRNHILFEKRLLPVKCCYTTIFRDISSNKPDDNVIFSKCIYFKTSVVIKEDLVKVTCANILYVVYENVHVILRPSKKVPNTDNPNVLLIGIDAVSRSNFIRTMANTFQFCEENGWVNLKGYNKIEDNTYPNLMAVLTGMEYRQAYNICDPQDAEKISNCPMIWKQFQMFNYTTAYAEDTPSIGTFNLAKAGFRTPPTDYYFRPYFLATDQLSIRFLCLRAHCTGPEKNGVRMQNLIKDFLSSTKDRAPGFGLFWMNSFSHEDVNCPTSMDDDFVYFFRELQSMGHLDKSIVVFFSDHGFRFGKIRQTYTGRLEEKLPFIYIWLPKAFRKKHKEEYKNLLTNSKRLTTPYDLYMTLQHILALYNNKFTEKNSIGCPDCKSLFKHITSSRTCKSSGIPHHYCSCSQYKGVNKNLLPMVERLADFLINELNRILAATKCSIYRLSKITGAQYSVTNSSKETRFLIDVETYPEAKFEATIEVTYNGSKEKYVLTETNRLDRYAPKTFCARNSPVEMYCYCKSFISIVTEVFCNNKFCFM